MLRTDTRIIEACRYRMGLDDLTGIILHQISAVAVQNTWLPGIQRRRVAPGLDTVAAGLDAVHLHAVVGEKRIKKADGIRPAADAGDQRIGQLAGLLPALQARLTADHRLEIANDFRIGTPAGRSEE